MKWFILVLFILTNSVFAYDESDEFKKEYAEYLKKIKSKSKRKPSSYYVKNNEYVNNETNVYAKNSMLSFDMGYSLSIHPLKGPAATRFENKVLTNDGTFVVNPRVNINSIKFDGFSYRKLSLVASRDCVNSPVFGAVYSFGSVNDDRTKYIGFGFGGYVMDIKPWRDRDIPKSWIQLNQRTGIVPVIGAEINFNILRYKNFEINSNTYLNPILTNTMIGISFSF